MTALPGRAYPVADGRFWVAVTRHFAPEGALTLGCGDSRTISRRHRRSLSRSHGKSLDPHWQARAAGRRYLVVQLELSALAAGSAIMSLSELGCPVDESHAQCRIDVHPALNNLL